MPPKKRSRLNLTPIMLVVLAFFGQQFLFAMSDIAYDALALSWDSALLFLATFFIVAGIIRFLQNRADWLERHPPKRD